MSEDRVVVIGGGLAGITAALSLADAGKEVVLLEARGHLGGRVSSISHPKRGWDLDNCQHACFRVYDRFFQLLARAGAQNSIKLQANTQLPFASPEKKAFAELFTGKMAPPNHMAGSMISFPFLSLRDKLAMRKAVKALAKLESEEMWKLDDMNFVDWLKKNGQTERAIERFWGFFVMAALNIKIEEASAAQACFLFKNGLFGNADAFDVGAFTSHLSESLDPALSKALVEAGVDIQLTTSAKSLKFENGALSSIETSNGEIQTNQVVLSTPHHITKRILDSSDLECEEISNALAAIDYRSLIGIHAIYKGERVPKDFDFAVMVDEPLIQIAFNRNHELDEPLEEGLQWISVPVSAADEFMKMKDEEMLGELDRVLDRLWPNSDAERIDHLIVKTPKATFAPTPGTAKNRPKTNALGANIALAGDWVMTEWPSVMEGAVRSGLQATAHLLGEEYDTNSNWKDWPLCPKRGDEGWRVW